MPSASGSPPRWPDVAARWTRPGDVRETVRKKWPDLLAAFAAGQQWAPLPVPVRGPSPAEIGERLGDVQDWAAEWRRAGRGPLRVEYKKVGGRHIGREGVHLDALIGHPLFGQDQPGDAVVDAEAVAVQDQGHGPS